MKSRAIIIPVAILSSALVGCQALLDFLAPNSFTVTFVNDSDTYDVELTLATAENENTPEDVLQLLGDERNITVGPGQTVVRVFNCDAIGALMIETAELQSPLIQPDTESGVWRLSEDFVCGDEIVFTFTHSDVLIDFDVSEEVRTFGTP